MRAAVFCAVLLASFAGMFGLEAAALLICIIAFAGAVYHGYKFLCSVF